MRAVRLAVMTTKALLLAVGFGLTGITGARQAPQAQEKPFPGLSLYIGMVQGDYDISYANFKWKFSGHLGGEMFPLDRKGVKSGRDAIGRYDEVGFYTESVEDAHFFIRQYKDLPVIRFRTHYLKSTAGNGIPFPDFKALPEGLNQFSYRDSTFAPPTFGPAKTSTPWLLFDKSGNACIMSPASNFMVAKMVGDGKTEMGAGLDDRLKEVPAGFDQDCVMVFAKGIGAAWDLWGSVMQKLAHKAVPANDSDVLLKSFGYWTDNGADYYYNYDPQLGYTGTLLSLAKRYKQEEIPLGYLQLDSWWYQKSIKGPSGKPGGAKKNNKLPIGSWNRYGGTLEYRAHPDLFPNGLAKFQEDLGLPLAVHSRWIDRTSPYHDRYRISGVGAVDPKWWDDTAKYLHDSGVVCYEQDWLDEIFLNSPEMASNVGVADAFTDGMANACKAQGIDMQYCMGTPRFFLQGLKYANLTTIRTSGDRFEPGKWADFLYVSQLAKSVGVWPWCDVFKSGETANMILATLSAGPVGTGDAIGKENKQNILMAARTDGVIVKPDQPLVPCDRTYQEAGQTSPFLASTFTDDKGLRTTYLFAFPKRRGDRAVQYTPRDLGISSPAYCFNLLTRQGQYCDPNQSMNEAIGKDGYTYLMFAPISKSGIALLGDLNKFVPTGKQRIASITTTPTGLDFSVRFAKQEKTLTISGVSPRKPVATAAGGGATVSSYDSTAQILTIEIQPNHPGQTVAVKLSR